LRNSTDSISVKINVGVPDIFRQIDNDGQWSEIYDNTAMFTNPWQGRTLYNNPGDGFGFPDRLVKEADLTYARGGSGDELIWELAIPWSTTTLFESYDGKEIAYEFNISGDRLYEVDNAARLKLVEIGSPAITEMGYSGGSVTLTFDSVPGSDYSIYYRDSVDDAWTLIEEITGQGNGMQYVDDGDLTDPDPSEVECRFYTIGM
jgi:hypothetical protein